MQRCTISSLFRAMLRRRNTLFAAQAVALVGTFLTVIVPLFIPLLVDEVLLHKPHGLSAFIRTHVYPFGVEGLVFFVLVLTLALRLAAVGAGIWQTRLFTLISKEIAYDLRRRLIARLERVSLKAYETLKSGALASRLVTDIETLDGFISVTVSKLLLSVLILLFSSAVLLWIDWKLGMFIILTNPVVVFFTAKLARKTGKLKREENRAIEAFQSELVESVDLIHQIRAANKEAYFFEKIRQSAAKLRDKAVAYGYKSDAAQKLSYAVFLSGYELFRAVSILAASYGELSVGLMLAIFSYLWVMVSPTQDVIGFYYALHNAKAACDRIGTLFRMPLEPVYPKHCDPFASHRPVGITARNVFFAYGDKPVLQGVSINIAPGAKVALVGPSGSGKTTLANILVGFYEPDEGAIYYGKCERREIGLAHIRRHVHMILQHPRLFNATLRFNVTLGEAIEENKIWEALRIAQLEETVRAMPNGLESIVGNEGIRLSGGQRQRVAIARMILADPDIIVLDESTSALDVHTEVKLFSALEKFWKDKTVITIAHRLSTIEKASYVYVLEGGKVVQHGTPEALSRDNAGYFATMI